MGAYLVLLPPPLLKSSSALSAYWLIYLFLYRLEHLFTSLLRLICSALSKVKLGLSFLDDSNLSFAVFLFCIKSQVSSLSHFFRLTRLPCPSVVLADSCRVSLISL